MPILLFPQIPYGFPPSTSTLTHHYCPHQPGSLVYCCFTPTLIYIVESPLQVSHPPFPCIHMPILLFQQIPYRFPLSTSPMMQHYSPINLAHWFIVVFIFDQAIHEEHHHTSIPSTISIRPHTQFHLEK